MIPSLVAYPKPTPLATATRFRADGPTIEAGLPRTARVRRVGTKLRRVWSDFDPTTPGGASVAA